VSCCGLGGDALLLTPRSVAGLTRATSVSVGFDRRAVSLLADGTSASYAIDATIPVTPNAMTPPGAAQVVRGDAATCFVLGDGSVQCSGNNADGVLGVGDTASHAGLVTPMGLSGVSQIALGRHHACAVRSDHTALCWGRNEHGQLGDGTTGDRSTPGAVTGLTDARSIGAGDAFTCALLGDGSVRCWGSSSQGQLGDGMASSSSTPVAVAM
jgi:hypothetical protein